MNELEQEVVEQKVRRIVGINASHKICAIVAKEQKNETEKARVLRWFVRYGRIVLSGIALLVAYAMDII